MAWNQHHTSLTIGTRSYKSCLTRLRSGKYRTLIVVMILFSTWLTLHFIRATVEYHQQIVRESVNDALKQISKGTNKDEGISTTSLPFDELESTEATTANSVPHKPDSKLEQMLRDHINKYGNRYIDKDNGKMEGTVPSITTQYTSTKPDLIDMTYNNIGAHKAPHKEPEFSATTESLIGNTAANININDNHLHIDNEQQYIVKPGGAIQPNNRDIPTSDRHKNIDNLVVSTESLIDSTTTALEDIERSIENQVAVKPMVQSIFTQTDGNQADQEGQTQSQLKPELNVNSTVNPGVKDYTNQQPQTIIDQNINLKQLTNTSIQSQYQENNVIEPQQSQSNINFMQQTVEQNQAVKQPIEMNDVALNSFSQNDIDNIATKLNQMVLPQDQSNGQVWNQPYDHLQFQPNGQLQQTYQQYLQLPQQQLQQQQPLPQQQPLESPQQQQTLHFQQAQQLVQQQLPQNIPGQQQQLPEKQPQQLPQQLQLPQQQSQQLPQEQQLPQQQSQELPQQQSQQLPQQQQQHLTEQQSQQLPQQQQQLPQQHQQLPQQQQQLPLQQQQLQKQLTQQIQQQQPQQFYPPQLPQQQLNQFSELLQQKAQSLPQSLPQQLPQQQSQQLQQSQNQLPQEPQNQPSIMQQSPNPTIPQQDENLIQKQIPSSA